MPSQVSERGGDGKQPDQRQGEQPPSNARQRRQQRYVAIGAVVVVLAAVAVIVGIKVASGTNTGLDTRSAISRAALDEVFAVTPDQMKAASVYIPLSSYPFRITSPAMTSAGKPELLYIGAEYCPYCAGERWAMAMALNQFGTFSGLRSITSTPNDTVASVPSFTFYHATYSSPYVAFRPVEQQTVSGKALETPSRAEEATLQQFDRPPYVKTGGIPFLDFGGKWIQDGINYDDAALQHQSFDTIASQLAGDGHGPSTPATESIAATAGMIISHLCALTGGRSLHDNAACQAFPTVISKASNV